MTALRWLVVITAVGAGLIVLTIIIGVVLPRTFTAVRTASYGRPVAEVWKVITDFPATPTWRPGVIKVIRGVDAGGKPVWEETFRNNMALHLATEEFVPEKRLVRRIFGEGLPFTGRWIFALAPEGGGTRIVLTEEGDVPNPFFRFVSKVIMGHDRHLDKYLVDLGNKFGEKVSPSSPK